MTLIITIAVTHSFYRVVLGLQVKDQVNHNLHSLEKARDSYAFICKNIEKDLKNFNDLDVIDELMHEETMSEERLVYYMEELKYNCSKTLINNESIKKILIIGSNGFAYSNTHEEGGLYHGNINSEYRYITNSINWLSNTNNREVIPAFIPDMDMSINSKTESVIYDHIRDNMIFSRTFRSGNRDIGTIIFVLNLEFLKSHFGVNNHGKTPVLVISKNYRIIGSRSLTDLTRDFPNNTLANYHITPQNILVTHSLWDEYNLEIYLFNYISILTKKLNRVRTICIIFLSVLIGIILLISPYASKVISKPFIDILNRLKNKNCDSVETELIGLSDRSSLISKLIKYFFLTLLLPCCFFIVVTFELFEDLYKTSLQSLSTKSLHLKQEIFDNELDIIQERIKRLIFNRDVQKLLYQLNQGDETVYPERIYDTLNLRDDSITIEFFNTKFMQVYPKQHREKYFQNKNVHIINNLLNSSGELIFSGISKQENAKRTLTYFRKVNDIYTSYNLIGYIKINVNISSLYDKIKTNLQEHYDYLYITDNFNNHMVLDRLAVTSKNLSTDVMIKNVNNSDKNTFSVQNSRYFISKSDSVNYGINFYSVISQESISEILGNLRWYIIITIITVLICVILSAFFLSLSIVIPFRKLLTTITQSITSKEFRLNTNIVGYDEISDLTRQYNRMIDRINELIHENYQASLKQNELQLLQKTTQFNFLQQQINPHFLYNTLDSINWMAYRAGAKDVCKMVSSLAKFFRGVIIHDGLIDIGEEIEHLGYYISIMQMRFLNKITFNCSINSDLSEFKTIKLILQPIVENAVQHGLENQKHEGNIDITGSIEDNIITFTIVDSGIGIEHEKLESIRENLDKFNNEQSAVGLNNVYKRLKIHFGEDANFEIDSELNMGTKVTISFPAIC